MKNYMDIQRLKDKYADVFKVGENVVIQVKVDGSNASFTYNPKTNEVEAFSRKTKLNKDNTLRGFYDLIMKVDPDTIKLITENGRYIIFGEWLCLSGDTIIKKASSGKVRNTMTLREMYKQKYTSARGEKVGFQRGVKKLLYLLYEENKEITTKNYKTEYHLDKTLTINKALKEKYIIEQNGRYIITEKGISQLKEYYFQNSNWYKDGFPSIYSLNLNTDEIQINRMADIFYTGEKEVFRLTTHKGYSIKATVDHPFLTPRGWQKLGDLKEFDCVAITDFISRKGRSRTYGKGSRTILKAQKDYKNKIKKCEKCGCTTGLELHHIDENYMNNEESNWMVLCRDCHKTIHVKTANQPDYKYEFDYITSIEFVGIEDCYDIAMTGGEELANFIANGFIVHNCKHAVIYPKEAYNKFYMFDVYDTEIGQYLPFSNAYAVYANLIILTSFKGLAVDFMYVPILYHGPFEGWTKTMEYLKENPLNAEPVSEGIVIKSQDRLDNKFSGTPEYLKIVNEQFAEVHAPKAKKTLTPEELAAAEIEKEKVSSIATDNRIQKELNKLIDEGIVPISYCEKDIGTIMKYLVKNVINDCIKEEPEIVIECPNFNKLCGGLVRQYILTKI